MSVWRWGQYVAGCLLFQFSLEKKKKRKEKNMKFLICYSYFLPFPLFRTFLFTLLSLNFLPPFPFFFPSKKECRIALSPWIRNADHFCAIRQYLRKSSSARNKWNTLTNWWTDTQTFAERVSSTVWRVDETAVDQSQPLFVRSNAIILSTWTNVIPISENVAIYFLTDSTHPIRNLNWNRNGLLPRSKRKNRHSLPPSSRTSLYSSRWVCIVRCMV